MRFDTKMNVLFVFCSEKLSIEFSSFLEKLVFFSYFIVKIDHDENGPIGDQIDSTPEKGRSSRA